MLEILEESFHLHPVRACLYLRQASAVPFQTKDTSSSPTFLSSECPKPWWLRKNAGCKNQKISQNPRWKSTAPATVCLSPQVAASQQKPPKCQVLSDFTITSAASKDGYVTPNLRSFELKWTENIATYDRSDDKVPFRLKAGAFITFQVHKCSKVSNAKIYEKMK